jgi:hypothetical protein
MPLHHQRTVNINLSSRSLGASDSSTIKAAFPASPIHAGELTKESVRQSFQDIVIDGEVNDGGHTFGKFSRDYSGAPDLKEVETGGGGLPASAYVPNPVSPGPGSLNPTDQPEPPKDFGTKPSNTWGAGVGSQLQPKTSSEQQSRGKLGDFVMGKAWGAGS